MYLPRGVEIFDTTWPAVGAYQKKKIRKKLTSKKSRFAFNILVVSSEMEAEFG